MRLFVIWILSAVIGCVFGLSLDSVIVAFVTSFVIAFVLFEATA